MKDCKNIVIAIDGPAASGKGSLAKKLAEELGYSILTLPTGQGIILKP